jgi:hypothetical protein
MDAAIIRLAAPINAQNCCLLVTVISLVFQRTFIESFLGFQKNAMITIAPNNRIAIRVIGKMRHYVPFLDEGIESQSFEIETNLKIITLYAKSYI